MMLKERERKKKDLCFVALQREDILCGKTLFLNRFQSNFTIRCLDDMESVPLLICTAISNRIMTQRQNVLVFESMMHCKSSSKNKAILNSIKRLQCHFAIAHWMSYKVLPFSPQRVIIAVIQSEHHLLHQHGHDLVDPKTLRFDACCSPKGP